MRSSLESILPWATGPVPDLCMGVLSIALGDKSIPVKERLDFLETVLSASPNEEHRQELGLLVEKFMEQGYFADLTTVSV